MNGTVMEHSTIPHSLFQEPAMAQQTPESPAKSRRSSTPSGVAVITAALMVGLAPAPDIAGRRHSGSHRPGSVVPHADEAEPMTESVTAPR
ncbi:hypothetical protein Aab01nite_79640 [Paractinoplanes abujensis]|uniref:Uncharacterized protein n=1 Tax=Paractinoplanes abujensis TaxID=882441 RepID=A0A7W7G0K8_9ACTN|nr:hypothetical protein [Actinoplanes abujensis]MBB4693173.1 hypothetical protein [Actinoplanes abujensis]GID24374.1 hypothetical protein Aab01nite_79640 [Actinoplanes abujensis]